MNEAKVTFGRTTRGAWVVDVGTDGVSVAAGLGTTPDTALDDLERELAKLLVEFEVLEAVKAARAKRNNEGRS